MQVTQTSDEGCEKHADKPLPITSAEANPSAEASCRAYSKLLSNNHAAVYIAASS